MKAISWVNSITIFCSLIALGCGDQSAPDSRSVHVKSIAREIGVSLAGEDRSSKIEPVLDEIISKYLNESFYNLNDVRVYQLTELTSKEPDTRLEHVDFLVVVGFEDKSFYAATIKSGFVNVMELARHRD